MSTPLQELIERLDARHEVIPVDVYRAGLEYAKAVATELLEKEKEQRKEEMWKAIVQYQIARKDMSDILKEAPEWFETYYNETFNQKQIR